MMKAIFQIIGISLLLLLHSPAHANEVAIVDLGTGTLELDAPHGFIYDSEMHGLAWPIVQATTPGATRNYAFFVEDIDLEDSSEDPAFIIVTPLSYKGSNVRMSSMEFASLKANMTMDLAASMQHGANLAKELAESEEGLPDRVESLGLIHEDDKNVSVLARQHYRESDSEYSTLVAIGMTHISGRIVRSFVFFPTDTDASNAQIQDAALAMMRGISTSFVSRSPSEIKVEEVDLSNTPPRLVTIDQLMESQRSVVSAFWVLVIGAIISVVPLVRYFSRGKTREGKQFAAEQEEKLRLTQKTESK